MDPLADNDGDGMKNGDEAVAGTHPLDAGSLLRILSLTSGPLLTWSSVSGRTYRVLATTEVNTNSAPISGVLTASDSTASFLDSTANNTRRFYRINVVP